jgi:RNA polymerase sigma-70 factor (ECF subfamily)
MLNLLKEDNDNPERAPMTGTELEFNKIHDTYAQRIKLYLAKLAGDEEAQDLAQETFARVSRSLHNFRGQSSLSTWIYKIATNTALDRIRKKTRSKNDLPLDAAGEAENINIWTGENHALEEQVIRGEMNDCIRNVVSGLPEAYRAVIVLSEFEGFKNEDIAKILGLGIESVKMRLHRARHKLKEELSNHCILFRDERNEFACEQKKDSLLGKHRIISLTGKNK